MLLNHFSPLGGILLSAHINILQHVKFRNINYFPTYHKNRTILIKKISPRLLKKTDYEHCVCLKHYKEGVYLKSSFACYRCKYRRNTLKLFKMAWWSWPFLNFINLLKKESPIQRYSKILKFQNWNIWTFSFLNNSL